MYSSTKMSTTFTPPAENQVKTQSYATPDYK